MSQFLLSVFHAPGAQSDQSVYQDEAEMQERFALVGAFNQKLMDEGRFVTAGGLTPPEQAFIVDGTGAQTTVVDGPRQAGAELLLGGFWIIEADNRDHAIVLTAQASKACGIPLEVRQLAG